jgi:hypothetical protein
MIFTLPHELHALARANKNKIYSLLMTSSWQTVKHLSLNKNNIGALPGMISVLHTFGSDLKYHIHAHCLVTFGGLDHTYQWRYPKRKDKIARYRHINNQYRNFFLQQLKTLNEQGKISYHGDVNYLIKTLSEKTWVVHNTKPTIDTTILENYLARYINRVAISKSRVTYLNESKQVQLLYNDYANQIESQPAPKKYKYLAPLSFIHQFLQHVLPPYFQKSRRYGLHSCASKDKYGALLPTAVKRNGHTIRTVIQIINQLIKDKPYTCQKCQSTDYIIQPLNQDKEWIQQYIPAFTPRSPPLVNKQITKQLF